MSIPTAGETYSKLMEHLRCAQEQSSMMAHLMRDDHAELARQWLVVSENFKRMQHALTHLAMGRMQ